MSGWTTVQLGEVSDFVRGVTFKPTDVVEAGTDGSVPCMRTKNVQLDLDLSDVWWIDRSHVKRDEQYLNEGDLLISSANSWNLVGKCSWIPSLESPSTFGGFVTALRAKPQQVDPRYLYRFFSSARVQATVRSFARQTTNISNLDLKRCAALPIPLPSVEEQRRIAAILDHADTLRAKRREALARLDELTQSIFIDMFGDPAFSVKGANAVTIGDLLDSAQYGTSEKSGAEGEYAVLRMNNITYQGQMDLTDLKYTDLPDDKVDRFTVRAGDVLFNRTNSAELVGKTAVYRGAQPMAYAGYLVRLRASEGNSPDYISAFLNSRYGKAVLRGMCKSIVGMANINAREVQAIRIPKAPSATQMQFEQRVAAVESNKARHRTALAELDALFASLQSRAFRGEL